MNMTTTPEENQLTFLDSSSQQTERIERSLQHVTRAVELVLADIALNGEVDEQQKQKLTKLGQHLMKISNDSDYLLGDITQTTGLVFESDTPQLTTAPQEHAQPVEAQTTVLSEEPKPENAEPKEDATDMDFYTRILDLEHFPDVRPEEIESPIEVSIKDNATLGTGEQSIKLDKHEVYLFNALMYLRDQPRTAVELRKFGFCPDAKSPAATNQTFFQSINGLMDQLNGVLGLQVIGKSGRARGTRYSVNPNLVLSDYRSEDDRAKAGQDVKKN